MTCVVFSSVIFLLLLAWLTFWEASFPTKIKKNSQRLQLDEELVELDEPLEAAHVGGEGIAVVGRDDAPLGVKSIEFQQTVQRHFQQGVMSY